MIDSILLLGMFNIGLLTALSPCMFPVLPSYLAYLSTSANGIIRGVISSLLVFIGLMTVLIAVTFIFNPILTFFANNFLQFQFIQGLLLILFGILLALNIFVSFQKINEFSASTQMILRKIDNPYLISFLIGFTFAIIAAPCAIILFFTAFTLIASEPFLNAIILILVFAMGAGMPFFVIGVIVPLIRKPVDSQIETPSKLIYYSRLIYRYLPRIAGLYVFILGIQLVIESRVLQRAFLN